MPKERGVNPVAAQKKADKQKQLQRQKKQVQSQRNEKLARRNPERLQRQIDELKELEQRGALRPKDKENLEQLEKDVRGIRRAREALGDAAPKFPSHERKDARQEQRERREGQQQHLGKRRRGEEEAHDSGSDTDPEVRAIPMPRDTPPPIPREHFKDPQVGPDGVRRPHALPSKPTAPAAPAQTTYSSAPQLRDLKKEAVKFMPSAVAQQKRRVKGDGRLLEPEEMDRLEKAGYYDAKKAAEEAGKEAEYEQRIAEAKIESGDVNMEDEIKRFEAEIGSFYPEEAEKVEAGPGKVGVEEVEDEGD